ncbi:protein GOS9-like, partial [Curcuma longa]|uniref:protein GOS9-like n=1 Tax=Curcuma longa TaxID=136217 RepID=UPI003D9F08F4
FSILHRHPSLGLHLAMANNRIGPWGGTGTYNFDIGRNASQITKVVLHAGEIVDSLKIFYVDEGNEVNTTRIGGGGGGLCEFKLRPGEYINSMKGSFRAYYDEKYMENYGEICITKLQFKTNKGRKHGPFGQGGGSEFSVPVGDGRIVGFFGQYCRYLNAIGVYVAPRPRNIPDSSRSPDPTQGVGAESYLLSY